MKKVVIDTNIVVSALWSAKGNPNKIIKLIPEKKIIPCFCQEILQEYKKVLSRPKFNFTPLEINKLLKELLLHGIESKTIIKSCILFADESDRIFYDTAKTNKAVLITGNKKHYPDEKIIMTPGDYIKLIEKAGVF